jgi:hypothetical protein
MGKPKAHRPTQTAEEGGKEGVCVSCRTAPCDGISPKSKPYKTCAGCRVKGVEAKRRSAAADKAEVAAATASDSTRDSKFEGFALEGELQRWAFQQVDQLGGQFAATATSPRRRPLVNQQASYTDPHVAYKGPASGVVCVVEIMAAFWDRYEHAYFHLSNLNMKIGRRGAVVRPL